MKKVPSPSGLTVLGEYLCKSIEYASVPVDSSEHSFNVRRIPILAHECVSYIKTNGNLYWMSHGAERQGAVPGEWL